MKKEESLLKIIRYLPIFLILLISIIPIYYLYNDHHNNLEREKNEIKVQFITEHKRTIKADVETIERYVKEEFSNAEQELKTKLKKESLNIHGIISSIYDSYNSSKTKSEIVDIIKNSIRNIEFNNRESYFFIVDFDGTNVFHSTVPTVEGRNLIGLKDSKGNFIVKNSIKIAKSTKGEGYITWSLNTDPFEKKDQKRIGFIKKFGPYNWYIGVGDYVDEFKKTIKNKIFTHLNILRYKDNRTVFVIDYEGNVLIKDNKILDNSEIFKTKRLDTYEKFISSNNKSKFVEYTVKPSNITKLSYLKKIDELNAIVGTGFDMERPNMYIKNRIIELDKKYDNDLKGLIIRLVITTIVFLFMSYLLSKYIEKKFQKYNEDLKRNNMLLNNSQYQAKIGSWEQTNDNNTLSWSDEVYRIFEVEANLMSFEFFVNRLHPDDKEKVISSFQNSIKNKTKYYIEHRLLFDDGRVKYVMEFAEHLYDSEGNHIKTYGTVQDVTERKKIDLMLTSVFQVIPDLLFIMKNDGTIIDYRAQSNNDFYVEPEFFIGKKMQEVLPEDIGLLFIDNIKSCLSDESMHIFKYKLIINEEDKYFEARMSKLLDDEHIMTIIRDITESVSYEEKLIFQSSLLEQSLSAMNVINEDSLFDYVNDSYVKMWGYDSKEEIIGTSPVSHCMDPEMPKIIKEKIEKEGSHVFHFKAKKKNGELFDALMAVKSIYFMDKKFYISSTMDITENERMKEESITKEKMLHQQSKMAAMGEMLGNIAHQWRQPLSTISTASTGVKLQKEMNCLSDGQLDLALTAINDSAQYLSTTIDDFRNFFSPNKEINVINIVNTLEKAIKLVSPQFYAKDIEFIENIENYHILSIENELVQVLINLLNNARDILVTKENLRRMIFINAYQKDNASYIEIIDNGGGIEKNIIDRIFEPYYTTKHKSQGTGIGLYMSEEIVKNHLNGILLVENTTYTYDEVEYTGAKFTIKIVTNKSS